MRKVFPLLVIALFLSSCLKQEDFPNRPDIDYLGFVPNTQATSKFDSLGYVKFSFTDGDGDLGLGDSDNESPFALGDPYYFNLFVRYFERQNGTFVEVIPPGIINVRFERLTSEGGNGSLQGEMNVVVKASGISPFDTVRYEMYIVDRALNHSDTLVTEPLVFSF